MKELQKEINKRIKHVVSLSKEIPLYVKKYKELGIDPDKIRSPQDLLKAYEKGLYTTPSELPELVYYKHLDAKQFFTSGTSGKPKEIWLNPDDERRIISQSERLYTICFKKNDRILNCFPKEPAFSGYAANLGLRSLDYNFYHFPAQEIRDNLPKFATKFEEYKPTALMCLTTFAYRLPFLLEGFGIDKKDILLQRLLVSAEPSSVERRKTISNELHNTYVYDLYASTENSVIGYENKPFTDEHLVDYPEIILFLTKEKNCVSIGETGDVLLTNLYDVTLSKPYMILLNYKIGDWAKCLEKRDDDTVTLISNIRRETAYLAGAKLHPTEVELYIEELKNLGNDLSGEYCIINYYDRERKAVGEIRIESRKKLGEYDKKIISEKLREKIYSNNFPVWNEVENTKNAKLLIEITDVGELYKGYEQYIKAGKPKRLLVL